MRSVNREQPRHRAAKAESHGVALAQLLHHQLVLPVGRHRKRCGVHRNRPVVARTIDRRARRDDQAAILGGTAEPLQQSGRTRNGARKVLKRLSDRQPDRRSTRQMENCRRQSGLACKRVEIGRVDLAVQPMFQADAMLFGVSDRAVANAMNAIAPVSQHPDEVPADEAIGAGNPHVHVCAL